MSNVKRVGLRMPITLYAKVEEVSKNYGIPVANLINFIVAQWVDNHIHVRDRFFNELRDALVEFSRRDDRDEDAIIL